ncbi:MAG: hypothetical protein J0M12_09595 [Deltaproteobacteria bacterium]|nr:hypothetical protein [Deltaproteobacteria bacterium]
MSDLRAFAVKVILSIAVFTVAIPSARAQNIFEAQASSGKSYLCAPSGSSYVSGKFVRYRFSSFSALMREIRIKMKSAQGASYAKLKSKRSKYKAAKAEGDSACKNGPPSSGGPTPTPQPGSTPTATPTPGAPQVNFNGDEVTSWGKSQFGIPQWLSANAARGASAWSTHCFGCHNPPENKGFGYVRQRISGSPMFFTTTEIPDSTLADLTAYLNNSQRP